jgi:hypothetical protein
MVAQESAHVFDMIGDPAEGCFNGIAIQRQPLFCMQPIIQKVFM